MDQQRGGLKHEQLTSTIISVLLDNKRKLIRAKSCKPLPKGVL